MDMSFGKLKLAIDYFKVVLVLANMGLTLFIGVIVRKRYRHSQNYLKNDEIEDLNRIATMYLDYAEDQAKNR